MAKRYSPRLSTEDATAKFLSTPWIMNSFWSRVRLQPGCWGWRGIINGEYGRFAVGGRQLYAHRLSYLYWFQHDPGDLKVCHSCGNLLCTNPDHLFLGTLADAFVERERDEEGRFERLTESKLREPMIREIRELYRTGATQIAIANRYGIAPNTVSQIVNRRTWDNVE